MPRAGILVTSVSVAEVRDVIEARYAIESQCARLAAMRATEVDVAHLQQMADRLTEVTMSGGDWGLAYIAADRQMHEAVADIARNPILGRVLGRLLVANARIWNVFFGRLEAKHADVSHQDTVDAIAAHDADAAEESVRHHLRYSSQVLGHALDPLLGTDDPGPAGTDRGGPAIA